MIPSMAAVRQAHILVEQAVGGIIAERARDLVNQAVTNPARTVEVVLALADMVAAARPPELPTDDVSYERYLKRAHAAHSRGERLEWVIQGEREYQRLRKRTQRKEAS